MRFPQPPKRASAGFSLFELLTTVAVVAILAGVALPSFIEAMERNRIVSQNNELLAAFSYARTEAIRRNSRVGVCALNAAGTGCATDNWNRGWLVWADTNRNNAYNAGTDETLRINRLQSKDSLAGGGVFNIQFGPRGIRAVPAAANAVLTLKPTSCTAGSYHVRTLTVRITGIVGTAESPCT